MRAFIVDDEPKVCQLIKKLVDWDELGIELVGKALNGSEALKGIREAGANIVITDIKMPGMDGIELISRLRDEDETINFIVISGYSEFAYAQNALRLGVSDYILKPVNKKELEDTLKRIKEQRQETDMGNMFRRLRHTYVEGLLEKDNSGLTTEWVNAEYSYKFSAGYFQGFVMKLDVLQPMEAAVMNTIAKQIKVTLGEHLDSITSEWEIVEKDWFFYGISAFPEENLGRVQIAYQDVYEVLSAYQKELVIPLIITIGIGEKQKEIGLLGRSMRLAKNGVERKLISGAGKVYFGQERTSALNVKDMLIVWNRHGEQALERLDSSGLLEAVRYIEDVTAYNRPEGWEIYQLARGAGERYISILKGKGVLLARLREVEEEFIYNLYNTSKVEDLWQVLREMILKTSQEIINTTKNGVSHQIRQAQKYIYQNFNKNITLDEVGKRVGLNGNYFSTLFKKEVGVGFLEYLTEVRVGEAKRLLTTTNDTVVSIASQVGYSDVKHFNRIFKRSAVLKPNEYRKLHS